MTKLTRRAALAGATAAAVGSGGFPTIWAQNIKDVTLIHAGPPVTAIQPIADQATKDLGFKVQMQKVENADLLNRFLSQSSTLDVADVSISYLRYLVGRKVLQAVPLAKYKYWDKTIPLFTKGEYPDGRKASTDGISPISVLMRPILAGRNKPPARPSFSPVSRPSPTATRWASARI